MYYDDSELAPEKNWLRIEIRKEKTTLGIEASWRRANQFQSNNFVSILNTDGELDYPEHV